MNPSEAKILIVEDNSDHAILARICLQRAGFEHINLVNSSAKCRAILKTQIFDIILLDYDLPNEDGLAILRRLKKQKLTEAAIVLVTGHGHEKIAVESMKAGAFDYIVKSGDYPGILPNVVKRVFEKFQIYREKKRMEEEILLRNRELQALSSVSTVLNESLILEEILVGAVGKIAKHLVLEAVTIYLKKSHEPDFLLAAGTGTLAEISRFRKLTSHDFEDIFSALTRHKQFFTDDLSATSLDDLATEGMRSLVAFPLVHKTKVLGALLAASKDIDYFSERRLKLLSSISSQIAISIQNANLYSQTDELKNNLENVFNSSLDLIITVDSDGRIRFFNERFAKIHSGADDFLGKNVLDFVPDNRRDLFKRKFEELKRGCASIYETEMLGPGGTAMPCLISQSRLKGREEFLMVIKDTSAIAQLQEQLIQSEKLSALGQMIAGAAHELNNPLAGILGYGQLLLEESLAPNVRSDVNVILKEARRCQNIVQNLLTFARKQNSTRQLIDINEVLKGVLDLQTYQLRVDGIDVTRELHPSLPGVFGDYHQLQQVLLHLIKNAHDALQKKPRTHRQMHIRTTSSGKMVQIIVSDNGIGISAEHKNRIFEPFFTTKEVGAGTGLGLSMCFGIVQSHQGKMYVESEPGKGATFTVELPVLPAEENTMPFEVMNMKPPAALIDS